MSPWPLRTAVLTGLAAMILPQSLGAATPSHVRISTADFSARVVLGQNGERRALGFGELQWDANLAAAANSYARELAATGKWQHSDSSTRPGQGENLWMGTRGAFTLEYMVGEWLAERKVFRPGTFPNVSTTGQWSDVGHYTQIIWPETRRVGCALSSSAEYEYLVCRYSAPGNVMGQRLGNAALASR